MTEEEIKQKFKETYPDYMYGDTPLSPYFDIWCYAIEIMEQENTELKDKLNKIERKCKFNFVDLLHDVENESKQEEQLEHAKEIIQKAVFQNICYNCDFGIKHCSQCRNGTLRKQAEQFIKENDNG